MSEGGIGDEPRAVAGARRDPEGNEEALTPGSADRVSLVLDEGTAERLAAEAVDRMIAKLDVATATLEAQLAELRRMRRAA